MCHSIHVAVNTWLNCSFFTLICYIGYLAISIVLYDCCILNGGIAHIGLLHLHIVLLFCIRTLILYHIMCGTLIFTRDSIYAIARICHANSARLSVTRVYCIKTAERIIEILPLSDRPIILVYRHQGSLCKSEGVTPNGGAKYKGARG